jgi:hypothetical protein
MLVTALNPNIGYEKAAKSSVSKPWKTVIVSGGFGGLRAAQNLKVDLFGRYLTFAGD